MNDLSATAFLVVPGPALPAQAPAQAASGFSVHILQQMTAAPAGPDGVTAKIAALLQKDGALPVFLQNLTPEELVAALAAMTPGTGVTGIEPSLTSDLVAPLSAQIQEDEVDEAALLTDVLNKIQPGISDDAVAKILTLLQAQPVPPGTPSGAPVVSVAADILQQLKDKVAGLQRTPAGLGTDALVKVKADILQFLKDEGMEPAEIENFLTKLAEFLKEGGLPAAETAAGTGPEGHRRDAAESHRGRAPEWRMGQVPEGHMRAEPYKPDLLARPEAAEEPAALPVKTKDTDAQNTPAPPLPPLVQQTQTPAPKAPGFGISPSMINALANSDGGFSSGGFGADGNRQNPDLVPGAGFLKPATVDALNNQNFTNYLTAARGAPSAVTQMVNIQLQRNINAKVDMMTLQLEPAELGRLDIKLKFDKDGGIKAHLSVDRPETLALLQKDAHHLEKVLQQSGLDLDKNALSFDLRQQGRQHNTDGYDGRGDGHGNADEFSAQLNGSSAENPLLAKIAVQTFGYITQSSVNIMV